MHKRQLKILIWLLALSPAVLALPFIRPGDLTGAGSLLNYLGRLAGIGGLSAMLVAAVLCCRVPGFDRPFGGLTKVWQLHHQLGAVAFILLLVHPLLLAFAAAEVSPAAAVATLTPSTAALWFGWVALILMMIFLAPSFAFFGAPDYQRWKWLHRLSGPAVVLALIHTFLLMRTLPSPWDLLIWVGFFTAAVAALAYRFLFSRLWGRYRYRVVQVIPQANNVVELTLQAEEKALAYEAGQFVYLTPYDRNLAAGCGEEHPYTISSAPGEPLMRIAIKDLGDASRAIQQIALGSPVVLEGPYGGFFPAETTTPELWIAGGIGITPFLGRVRELAQKQIACDIHLVFCVQDESRALFMEELASYAQVVEGFRLTVHYFYREGPLQQQFLTACCSDLGDRDVYVCGPLELIALARAELQRAGVDARKITTEEFVLL